MKAGTSQSVTVAWLSVAAKMLALLGTIATAIAVVVGFTGGGWTVGEKHFLYGSLASVVVFWILWKVLASTLPR